MSLKSKSWQFPQVNSWIVGLFGFEKLSSSFFLFYTEMKVESKRWVKVLDLIVRMNKAGVGSAVNPFDYEKYLVEQNELSRIERYESNERSLQNNEVQQKGENGS